MWTFEKPQRKNNVQQLKILFIIDKYYYIFRRKFNNFIVLYVNKDASTFSKLYLIIKKLKQVTINYVKIWKSIVLIRANREKNTS